MDIACTGAWIILAYGVTAAIGKALLSAHRQGDTCHAKCRQQTSLQGPARRFHHLTPLHTNNSRNGLRTAAGIRQGILCVAV